LKEVRELDTDDFEKCWSLIPAMKAEETLRMITATSYPQSKNESQQKIHKELHREMMRFEPEREAQALDDLAMIMKAKV
jgi:hypothetical protein